MLSFVLESVNLRVDSFIHMRYRPFIFYKDSALISALSPQKRAIIADHPFQYYIKLILLFIQRETAYQSSYFLFYCFQIRFIFRIGNYLINQVNNFLHFSFFETSGCNCRSTNTDP